VATACGISLAEALRISTDDPVIVLSRDHCLCEGENPAAQRIGVQRPATALTGSDPDTQVCRQMATTVNRAELLMVRCNALLGGRSRTLHPFA
jgi:hypothetical protein